ncbi:MAG: ECF-type sigma factor, partial [Gemmataceae bacterium]
ADRPCPAAPAAETSAPGEAVPVETVPAPPAPDPHGLLSLDEALARLSAEDATAASIANLHLFAGLSIEEAAQAMGLSRATAYRNWTYARAWLQDALDHPSE